MTRTPLARLLARAYALTRLSARSGAPLDEVLQQMDERRAARRRFLQQGSAAAAALGLAACAPAARRWRNEEPVVIVGAGIAGLGCAWRLRKAGVPVKLYEAQNRVGGRMLSLRGHFADNQVCELGAELIDTGHKRMRRLAGELRLHLDDLLSTETRGLHESWYFGGAARSEREILQAFAPMAQAIVRDQALIGDGDIDSRSSEAVKALDRMSLAEWFERNGVDGWMRSLADVAFTTEMGLECAEQSALNLLTFISPDLDRLRLFGDSDERFRTHDGNDAITTALGQRLGDAVETGSALEAVRGDAAGGYVVSLRRGAASVEVKASRLVLAIPFTTLREVKLDVPLPAPQREAIARLRYGTNAKLMIGFERRLWRERHHSTGSLMTDLPLQTTWETSRRQSGAAGLLTNFTGGRHGAELGEGTPKARADEAAAQLDAVFPGVAASRGGAREARFHWPSFRWTQGSYACFTPGDWTSLREHIATQSGNLYFIGEHCSPDNQGFMEGGLETGELAAQSILGGKSSQAAVTRRQALGLA